MTFATAVNASVTRRTVHKKALHTSGKEMCNAL